MSNFILEAMIHPDPKVNAGLPRYSQCMLGRAYQLKHNSVKGHIIVPEEDIIVEDNNVQESAVTSKIVETEDNTTDVLNLEGAVGFSLVLISAEGRARFEQENSRKRKRLTVVQVGYSVKKVLHLDSTKVQSRDALKTGKYLHMQLNRDPKCCQEYLDQEGWHYITKVFLGCKAARTISYDLESARERKKFEAEVTLKLGFGPLSIQFSARFGSESHSENHQLQTNYRSQAIGGDVKLLQAPLAGMDIKTALAEEYDTTWVEYLNSAAAHPSVVRVEVEPVSSACIPLMGLSEAEKMTFQERVELAQKRKQQLSRQKCILEDKLKSMAALIRSTDIQEGACRDLMKPYRTAVNSFVTHHIEEVSARLTEYLRQPSMQIINGDPCQEGGSQATTPFDLETDRSFLTKKGSLDKPQMEAFFEALTAGSRKVFTGIGANVLWDGPWIFGEPMGIPKELLFFHTDVNLPELSEVARNRQWRLRVSGEEWDIGRNSPIFDEHTLVLANTQEEGKDGGLINFDLLPAFFRNIPYMGRCIYTAGHEYCGDWKGGKWDGVGRISFASGHEVHEAVARWMEGTCVGSVEIRFASLAGDARVKYIGQALFTHRTWNLQVHGEGTMELTSGKLEDWQWKWGKAVVRTEEEAKKVMLHNWFASDVQERVEVGQALREAIADLKDEEYKHQKQNAEKTACEAAATRLEALIEQSKKVAEVLNHAMLRSLCGSANDLLDQVNKRTHLVDN